MNFNGIRFKKVLLYITVIACFLILFTQNFMIKDINNEKISLELLLKTSLKAAVNGGYQVVSARSDIKVNSKGLTKEGLNDIVTNADFLSHCTMLETIKKKFPSIKIISEELNVKCNLNDTFFEDQPILLPRIFQDELVDIDDVVVWIDPLDATFEYTEKLYEYVTTMVCVAIKGKPIIGVIHKPFFNKTSWAWVNKSRSSDLLKPSSYSGSKIKIIVSRSHAGTIKDILREKFKNLKLIVAAGAGYKSLEVAKGRSDAYIHSTAIKKWDICAGNAIINAVGGKMTTLFNEEINYDNIDNVINERGLLATLKDHNMYIKTLL